MTSEGGAPQDCKARTARVLARILPTGRAKRGMLMLVGGSAGAQLIALLAMPVLTRLFTPDDFGILAGFGSLLAVLAAIAGFRYEGALPLVRSERLAVNGLFLVFLSVVLASVVCLLLVWVLRDAVAGWLNVPALAAYLWLLPVGVFMAGSYQALNLWATRRKAFGMVARTRLTQSSGAALVKIGAGLLSFGPLGLIVGEVIGRGCGSMALARSVWKQEGRLLKDVTWRRIFWFVRRYRRFPIFSTWSIFVNTLGHQLPPILFLAFFSPVVAGLYLLVQRVSAGPLTTIGQAAGQVYLSEASDARRQGRLGTLSLRLVDALVRLSVGPAVLLAWAAPQLFGAVFGPEWRDAGDFARFMAPALVLGFVFAPLANVVSVAERQGGGLMMQSLLAGARVAGILIGVALGEPYLSVLLFGVGGAAAWLVFAVWLMRIGHVPVLPVLRSFVIELLVVCPFVLTLWLSGLWLHNGEGTSWGDRMAFVGIVIGLVAGYLLLRMPSIRKKKEN